jgi:3-oxoadipate enol-lactonase
MDFLGQGQSAKPRTKYHLAQHVDEVRSVLDAAGVETANVVGVSYGGEVAMLCGINAPERVRSLVVANSASRIDRATRARADRWLLASRFRSGRILWQCVYPDLYSSDFLEKNWEFVARTAPSFDLLDFDALQETLKAFMELDITDQLGKITVPTLILASDEDATKPAKYSQEIQSKIRSAELKIISGAGHLAMWEKPDNFNREMIEFLNKRRS